MKRLLFLSISLICLLTGNNSVAQIILPVRNLNVGYDLTTNWEGPRKTLLTQDFEDGTFPPAGWQATSNSVVGWFGSMNGGSVYFVVPQHTTFAIANDDLAGGTNNGCCDYLITPTLDLSVCEGFKLSFDSYFNGNNGQKATVEMSNDNGTSWSLVQEMDHFPNWQQVEIDLSTYSGSGGLSSVKFAFHADDQGNQASGWAVDNVKVFSDSMSVINYTVLLDQNLLANTTEPTYAIDPSIIQFGTTYNFCVNANYTAGQHADTCVLYNCYYLYPPDNLQASASDSGILFTWQLPLGPATCTGYNLYIDGNIVAGFPVSQSSYFFPIEFGEACIELTARHDITMYGFPGQIAESIKTSACGFVDTGFDLPFDEDFSSGSLTLNKWTSGNGWSITGQAGNAAPSVKYEAGKATGSYSSVLTSWYFNSMGYDDCPSIVGSRLAYNIKLNDVIASGTEELIVELLTDNGIVELKRYKNEGSFNWLQEDMEITQKILDYNFQVRFRTEGTNPQNIQAWYIDNINIYNYISDYWNGYLEVSAVRQGNPENDILVSWNSVTTENTILDYIFDDGTAESWLGLDSVFQMGNEFQVSDGGVLQKASVLCKNLQGNSAQCVIEIFDADRNLVGSSEPFIPQSYVFTDVYLPDIPFNGTFYAMLRTVSPGLLMHLGVDGNGPNAMGEFSWFYDGTIWTKLIDYTSTSGVIALRVSALIGETVIDTTNPCDILGYNIYRKDYSSDPAGPNLQGSGEYAWIGSVPFGTNEFVDRDISNIDNNCFEYSLTLQYIEGEGSESGSAWSCIYVDTKEHEKSSINIYPNPASDFLIIQMNSQVVTLIVYNITGTKMAEIPVKNQSDLKLDISHFSAGIYSVRFLSKAGETSSRKFIKL